MKGNLPPLLANAEYQIEQLIAAMDFAQVDMSILHTYPTFGIMSRMHRQAVRRYRDRLRRIVPLPFDTQNPLQFSEMIEDEINYGGVCGLQFFTGWHQSRFASSWDDPQMNSFWNFVVSLQLPVYFTLALGHPSQFMERGRVFYLQELERLARWMDRFPEATVVVTHGLPWREHIEHNRIALPAARQKVSEAEALFEAGIFDILVTNEVVDRSKLRTFAELVLRGARLSVCAGHEEHVALLDEVMSDRGVRLTVRREFDAGGQRGGVSTADELLVLAQRVHQTSSLAFGGIQAYQGMAQHMRDHEERCEAISEARRRLIKARTLLEEHELPVRVISGAGTGTFELEAASGVHNEVQPGSYVFHDADYARNLAADGQPVSTWRQSAIRR